MFASFPVYILVFSQYLALSISWHAYHFSKSINGNCSDFNDQLPRNDSKKVLSKLNLWPIINNESNAWSPTSTLYGSREALQELYKHQHPKNCSEAKFLISHNYVAGFGSEVHANGALLGLAISLGRVFLQYPIIHRSLSWQINNSFCSSQNLKRKSLNLECYYEPWSSCTIYDALGPDALKIIKRGKSLTPLAMDTNQRKLILENIQNYQKLLPIINDLINKYKNHKIIIATKSDFFYHGFIPLQFYSLLECSPMKESYYYYWWRAISVTYLLRPNLLTKKVLDEKRLLIFGPHMISEQDTDTIVGMYVRKGDKHIEMKDISMNEYFNAVNILWGKINDINHKKNQSNSFVPSMNTTKANNNNNNNSNENNNNNNNNKYITRRRKYLFIGTEENKVLNEVIKWCVDHHWEILFTNLFDRDGLSAAMTRAQKVAHPEEIHHEYEYLSMLLNIDILLRCASWVCPLRSNFCRLIDELRTTIGHKVYSPFADLSRETCRSPPCIGTGITNFQW